MKTPKAIVNCRIHGRINTKNNEHELIVNIPKNKRDQLSGCPVCNQEKRRK